MALLLTSLMCFFCIAMSAPVINLPKSHRPGHKPQLQAPSNHISRSARSTPPRRVQNPHRIDFDGNDEVDFYDPFRPRPEDDGWNYMPYPFEPGGGWPGPQGLSPPIEAQRKKSRINRQSVLTWRITSRYSKDNGLAMADLTYVIERALEVWGEVIPIDFRQVTNDREFVDIEFRFLNSVHDDLCGRQFNELELAHRKFVKWREVYLGWENGDEWYSAPAVIHFNGDIDWALGDVSLPHYDLFTIALHEIGHAFGLSHSDTSDTVMNAIYSRRFTKLTQEDVTRIQAKYGVRRNISSLAETASPVPPATTTKPPARQRSQVLRNGCTPGPYTSETSSHDQCRLVNVCVALPVNSFLVSTSDEYAYLQPWCVDMPQCRGTCGRNGTNCVPVEYESMSVKYEVWRSSTTNLSARRRVMSGMQVPMLSHKACACEC